LSEEDWPTYHRDNARTGLAANFPTVNSLEVAWTSAVDSAVYGQPLVIGSTVYAATTNNTVYAWDADTGTQRWHVHVGTPIRRADLPCGNVDPLGILSTMVYDPATRLIFAVAETEAAHHTLFGLDAATGAIKVTRAAEPPRGERITHQQRGALTLLNDRVYIPYGGLNGDCGQYVGSVVSLPTVGDGPVTSYAVPTANEGGIWAAGGGIVNQDRLIYSVGNGAATNGTWDGSDSVVALTPQLQQADAFAPISWPQDNARDLDLGSMTPALVGSSVFVSGKQGVGYVLRANHFGGVGGQLNQGEVCPAFGAAAVWGNTVYVPCVDGTRAVQVGTDGSIVGRWQAPVPAQGSPVVGGGAVWVIDYGAGTLYLLDPDDGAVRARLAIGPTPHFASPTLAHRRAYVGAMNSVVAVRGGGAASNEASPG
jgi:hypothetical protein